MNFNNSHIILVVAFSSFWGCCSCSAFCLVVHQPCKREQTFVTNLTTSFIFKKLALGRKPVFTERSRANTSQTTSARLSKNGPMVSFASDTSLPRHTSTSWCGRLNKRWRQCVLVFAHDRYSHDGSCTGLLSNTGLILSTGNKHLFLLQHHSTTFDSWSLFLIQFSHAWHQSFVIEVSDLCSSSPLSSISDNCASTSSDESPCRTIPKRFWVDQTHLSLVCTDFPRPHQMEFLTSTTELHPILYRIPEYCHHERNREEISVKRSVFLVETCPLFWASCSSRLTFFLNWELWMILFRAEAIFSSNISNFGKFFPINHLHLFDPQHSIRWKNHQDKLWLLFWIEFSTPRTVVDYVFCRIAIPIPAVFPVRTCNSAIIPPVLHNS